MATRIACLARTHASTVSFLPLHFESSITILMPFTELDLPEYESYEDLRQRLYTAVTAGSEYFGFA